VDRSATARPIAAGVVREMPRRSLKNENRENRSAEPRPDWALNTRPAFEELPEEHPVTLEINGRPVARLLCTPEHLRELGAGWVFGQGFIFEPAELGSVTARDGRISVMIDAPGPGGAGWGVLFAAGFDARHLCLPDLEELGLIQLPGANSAGAWRIERNAFIRGVEAQFEAFRDVRGAGGVHQAATTDGAVIGQPFPDLSRHNAVDKAVGSAILRGELLEGAILCVSGRISADIVLKAWRSGCSVVASRSLPTAEAVELAHLAGITLVGRVLDGRRAVYSHVWRIYEAQDGA
jgi:FdhD protein